MPALLRVIGLVPGWIALLGFGWSATAAVSGSSTSAPGSAPGTISPASSVSGA